MNASLNINRQKYSRLASRIVVKAIESDEEYDRLVAAVGSLMEKGEDRLSREESALLETLAILIEAYDVHRYPIAAAPAHETLSYLMEASGRTARDLLPIFGTRGRISEVLNGKRAISKEQAKKLAAYFKVTTDLFI